MRKLLAEKRSLPNIWKALESLSNGQEDMTKVIGQSIMAIEILIKKGVITDGEIQAKIKEYEVKFNKNPESPEGTVVQSSEARSDEDNLGRGESGILPEKSVGGINKCYSDSVQPQETERGNTEEGNTPHDSGHGES